MGLNNCAVGVSSGNARQSCQAMGGRGAGVEAQYVPVRTMARRCCPRAGWCVSMVPSAALIARRTVRNIALHPNYVHIFTNAPRIVVEGFRQLDGFFAHYGGVPQRRLAL